MSITKLLSKTLKHLLILTMLASCGSPNSDEKKDSSTQKINTKFVFDVPSLIGKNIDEIRKVLGKPSENEIEPTKLQMKMKFDSWDNSFEKEGRTLYVTFNPQNRQVIDFFIGTTDASGSTSDYSDLFQICNVTNDDSNYTIEPVPTIKDNSKYTGIKIVVK
jgi:hypothetical protein